MIVTGPIRATGPLLDVVEVFLQALNDEAQLHGAIAKTTKRFRPTVCGVLGRLEDAGWITGQWEDQQPGSNKPAASNGSTPTGVTAARHLLAAHRPNALHHNSERHRVQPEPCLAFVGCLRTLLVRWSAHRRSAPSFRGRGSRRGIRRVQR